MLKPLYEQPSDSVLDIEHLGLVNNNTREIVKEINFHHTDGMYSYCTLPGKPESVFHLSCGTEAKFVKPIKE